MLAFSIMLMFASLHSADGEKTVVNKYPKPKKNNSYLSDEKLKSSCKPMKLGILSPLL